MSVPESRLSPKNARARTIPMTKFMAADHAAAIVRLLDAAERPRLAARREAAEKTRRRARALADLAHALHRTHG